MNPHRSQPPAFQISSCRLMSPFLTTVTDPQTLYAPLLKVLTAIWIALIYRRDSLGKLLSSKWEYGFYKYNMNEFVQNVDQMDCGLVYQHIEAISTLAKHRNPKEDIGWLM